MHCLVSTVVVTVMCS